MPPSSTPNGGGETAGDHTAVARHPKLGSASETLVVATFANRNAAEHMLVSLGHHFRRRARKGGVAAFLIRGNADGSFSLVQSRVLMASGVFAAVRGVAVSMLVGFMGIRSALRGGKTVVHGLKREKNVGAETQGARDILAKAGPRACVLVVRCADPGEAAAVISMAAERAHESWHGSRAEFIADLDQAAGDYDWLLPAIDESRPQRADQTGE